jgi:hypothetical protein
VKVWCLHLVRVDQWPVDGRITGSRQIQVLCKQQASYTQSEEWDQCGEVPESTTATHNCYWTSCHKGMSQGTQESTGRVSTAGVQTRV